MNIMVTGSAGFIGAALVLRLLEDGHTVVGLDNHNNYYDVSIKEASVARFLNHPNYFHNRIDLIDRNAVFEVFKKYPLTHVVNLAAQAGVRNSIANPSAYIDSNIMGFANVLEACRNLDVRHLVYASSSSVYGGNSQLPYSTDHNVDHPLNLYAATKKANELMAHSYSHLYNLPTTGLRFFTVYGPWSRPDMALFKFTEAILAGEKVNLFNHGNHLRDFTYIDDIVEGIVRVLKAPPKSNPLWDAKLCNPSTSSAPWRIFNIGSSNPIRLIEYVNALEIALGISAKKAFLPIQPGDMQDTYADVSDLFSCVGYKPKYDINIGVNNFVKWYKKFYNIN
ncbi:NAD-dependent epimerase/dehydratase family protein [Polynucleobacter paneuropaeus]|nr:NAD-dependent epimerase/dehydratase family protein [Polynucleobacter paneuropaeus]